MRFRRRAYFGVALVAGLFAAACADSGDTADASGSDTAGPQLPANHPPVSDQQAAAGSEFSVTVLETLTAGGYTYARVEAPEGEFWAAGPVTTLTIGESIALVDPMDMGSFPSKALDRTFDQLFFVAAFQRAGDAMSQAPDVVTQAPVTQTMNAGGYTFAEVETEEGLLWLAGPETQVSEGDMLSWQGGMVMRGFISRSLDRTFEEILFVEAISVVR